jgi:NTE family protein
MSSEKNANKNQKDKYQDLGIALGSGAARGISHLGVMHCLLKRKIEPQIVAGSSIGALIGACYAAGKFEEIESWFKQLTLKKLLVFLDPKLTSRGGLADGAQFVTYLKDTFGDIQFSDLDKKLIVVATDMRSGREIWLETGSVWEAVRASMAYPGIISPVVWKDLYLLDGGLVNPVPVIACRANGARRVIAINLNSDMLSSHRNAENEPASESGELIEQSLFGKFSGKLLESMNPFTRDKNEFSFNTIDVLSSAINIMQDKITRSRLAGEPPDVMLMPRLGKIGMFEIDRFDDIYAEGKRVAEKVNWDDELY